jgi:hypothetical protein
MFNWLFAQRGKSTSVTHELGLRANIADKLRSYDADEDTTISEFSLADDEKERKATNKMTSVRNSDVWNQANPGEMGKSNRDDRQKSGKDTASRHSTDRR